MDIKISKSSKICHECTTSFTHEQEVLSRILPFEGQLVRQDFCPKCWSEVQKDKVFSSWTNKYYDPEVAEQEPAESFTPLRQAFYDNLEKNSDRASLAQAYLAAQLLRRQKVFRLIKETVNPDDDTALILFNDRIGNRLIEVSDPTLSHEELEMGRIQLMNRLAELEAPDDAEENGPQNDESELLIEAGLNG
jgi:hypothetical protein